ncbi:MAG: ABC transporter permease subunit [Bacteriovorax sp.]|nr:ABC transporter permease subunit [Bacteriovorax sp.]
MYIKKISILVKKELKDSFYSPLIYILTGLFCFMMGWLFFNYLMQAKTLTTVTMTQAVITPIFGNMNFIFVFLCPLLTMRTLAEERKQATLDLLLRSELSEMQIIIGKFISNAILVIFMLSFTFVFPLILAFSGYSDWGVVGSSYLGVLLSVMAYLSVGLFCSSLTDNQIVASLLTFCILLGSMLMVISVNATNNYLLALVVQYLTVPFHYEGFVRGVVHSYSLVYFASYLSFFFLLTLKSLQSRKW